MKKLAWVLGFAVVLGCSDDKGMGNLGEGVRPGWTMALADQLVGCRPSESTTCMCIKGKVVTKYTPEEVKNPTPYITKDLLTIFSSCESSQGGTVEVHPPPQGFSYELNGENCTTGKHSFATHAEFCTALQNSALNNHCALEARQLYFEKSCPGPFRET